MKPRVLVVDDDRGVVKFVSSSLQARGYEVEAAGDGADAIQRILESPPQLVILDIMLPSRNGFEVCERVRAESTVPIVMLSARGEERDKVQALEAGADDYLTKPFGVSELLARVAAVLRRSDWSGPSLQPDKPLSAGGLSLDPMTRGVSLGGRHLKLTPTEFSLLHLLASHPGRVFTHEMLLRRVWGPEFRDESDYLRIYVYRLRRKLQADGSSERLIETVPGIGYRFDSARGEVVPSP
jgi:two-component system, OmpR family, KDP operon response regulator KdpE